jgi:hypothetical protein
MARKTNHLNPLRAEMPQESRREAERLPRVALRASGLKILGAIVTASGVM